MWTSTRSLRFFILRHSKTRNVWLLSQKYKFRFGKSNLKRRSSFIDKQQKFYSSGQSDNSKKTFQDQFWKDQTYSRQMRQIFTKWLMLGSALALFSGLIVFYWSSECYYLTLELNPQKFFEKSLEDQNKLLHRALRFSQHEIFWRYFLDNKTIETFSRIALQLSTSEETAAQKMMALRILANLSAYDSLIEPIAKNLMLEKTIQQFVSDPKFKGDGIKCDEALLYQEIFSNLVKCEKWLQVFLDAGYVSYVAQMLHYPNLNTRHIAIKTIASFAKYFRGRLALADTDIFSTLLQYVYDDDPFGTLKIKFSIDDDEISENVKKYELLNLAKFSLHQLYISLSVATRLLEHNQNIEANITGTMYDELSTFNYPVTTIRHRVNELLFNIGVTIVCGMVWGAMRAIEAHRPTTKLWSTALRKGSLPAVVGGLTLLFFVKLMLFIHDYQIVKTGEPTFYFLFVGLFAMSSTLLMFTLTKTTFGKYCLVPAFGGLSELHPPIRRAIRSVANKVLGKERTDAGRVDKQ
jgi:hypothetical protein